MAYRRLSMDVSTSEMLRLREEGMSNRQIAAQLDVSYNTILKYIGKEPRNPRMSVVKNERGAVGKAMVDALNAKCNQEAKRSIKICNSCSNCGVACSVCIRNPFLKDYFSNKKGE